MKPLEKKVEIDDRVILVKELTVAEIRTWMADLRKGDGDLVDASLFDTCSISDFVRFTDLTTEEVDAFTPSQLRHLEEVCREVNADFFGMRERLAAVGKSIALQDFPGPSAH